MAFCNQCGKPMEAGSRFCSSCGAPLDAAGKAAVRTVQGSVQSTVQNTGKKSVPGRASAFWNGFFGVWFKYEDTSYHYKEEDRQQNRYVSLLSYLHVLVLVPLVSMRESPFTQYHANVGLNLLAWEVGAEILWYLILHFLGWIPVLRWVLWILRGLTALVFVILSVFGIRSALKGSARELQFFSAFKFIR